MLGGRRVLGEVHADVSEVAWGRARNQRKAPCICEVFNIPLLLHGPRSSASWMVPPQTSVHSAASWAEQVPSNPDPHLLPERVPLEHLISYVLSRIRHILWL